jgi:dTDP-4-dehydrorhamnose reductase
MNQRQLLITGANGQLGKALRLQYPAATFRDSSSLNIADSNQLDLFEWKNFVAVINAAAYTQVDEAESPEGRKLAWRVNAEAVANLAKNANKHGLILVHISSDYVFDGLVANHKENEPFSPLGVYGQSKAAGDIAASTADKYYIVRTSWVIGDGKNFVRTMLELASKGINPKVVADQTGRPTFTSLLASAIDFLLSNEPPYGTYNLSNAGRPVTWADLARTTFALSGHSGLTVSDITTQEFFAGKEFAAPRPTHSTFDLAKIESLGFSPTDWQTDLKKYIKEEAR